MNNNLDFSPKILLKKAFYSCLNMIYAIDLSNFCTLIILNISVFSELDNDLSLLLISPKDFSHHQVTLCFNKKITLNF